MRNTLILAAATALISASAFAEDQSAQQPAPTSDGGVMICKSEPASTGSRIGARKICMTRNEWRAQEQQDRSIVDQASSASLRSLPPEAGGGN